MKMENFGLIKLINLQEKKRKKEAQLEISKRLCQIIWWGIKSMTDFMQQ